MQRPAASVLGSAALQAARRRPVEDLLARCKLSSKRPRVATLGGMSEVAPLLLAKWPECSHEHTDAVALPTDTPTFDLVITGTPGPVHLAQLLERVSPGGALAMVVSDAPAEQLAVLRDAAAGLGHAVEAAPPQRGPELYCDALLGPLCASLDIWRTTYTHRLQDVEAAWRCYAQAEPALRAVELEALAAESRRSFQYAFPARTDGTILVPSTHLLLMARRPSLVGIYAEYIDYHDHQLDKGWKS